jgi:hypothetical protein
MLGFTARRFAASTPALKPSSKPTGPTTLLSVSSVSSVRCLLSPNLAQETRTPGSQIDNEHENDDENDWLDQENPKRTTTSLSSGASCHHSSLCA